MEVNKDGTLSEANTDDILPIEVDVSVESSPRPTSSRRNNSLRNFMDHLTKHEETLLNESLGEFIFGCNVPFVVTESVYFKNFIKTLRPAYAERLPSRKTLATTILDATYTNCVKKCSTALNSESVLLIDGWKNTSSNSKTVVTILHCSDGKQAFVDAWDLSGSTEDSDKLAEIVIESSKIALNTYNSKVYAVVSDNASVMVKMWKLVNHCVWHTTCNSHSANLLAKTFVNTDFNNKVCALLKEFKHVDLEKVLTTLGGTKIKLPCETRCCSYRDSYICLIKNLEHMRLIAAGKQYKKVKQDVVKLLFDDDFITEINDYINLFHPVCELINKCQSKNCSLADAVDLWLSLKLPEKFARKFQIPLEERKEKVLTVYALSAFYLHPKYDKDKINKNQKKEVYQFLFKHLDAEGIGDLDNFNC